eukprot:TRINITY_DN7683_c0_g1_i3.p1 TRINITY_DN7683_c0_g1~~TRINITY_DN7683_c0_g1_i3.p1  ORF type:complete len:517 (-),score=150.14 TRINITY_DN7683_c0_g1_i3:442-1992(-)
MSSSSSAHYGPPEVSSSHNVPNPSLWSPYRVEGCTYSPLFCSNETSSRELRAHVDYTLVPDSMQIVARLFEDEEGAWIAYKQNFLKVGCLIHGHLACILQPTNTLYVCDPAPSKDTPSPIGIISALHMTIHAVCELPYVSPSTPRPHYTSPILSQHVPARPATSPEVIQIYPTEYGPSSPLQSVSFPLIEWTKLKFAFATGGNGKSREQQEYFRLVVSLVGTVDFSLSSLHATLDPSTNTRTLASVVSPRLKVIGQNPGRFKRTKKGETSPPPPPTLSSSSSTSSTSSSHPEAPPPSTTPPFSSSTPTSVPAHSSSPSGSDPDAPYISLPPPSWYTNEDGSIFRMGNVGINVTAPPEALTVGGNILVAGNIMKPSDVRIKRNIVPVQTGTQLQNIQNLQMYNYDRIDLSRPPGDVTYVPERGFLAQEVQRVVPGAVRTVGDVRLPDGTKVDDMLVVDDRVLLMETIGATQELGHTVQDVAQETSDNSKYDMGSNECISAHSVIPYVLYVSISVCLF